MTRWFVLVVIIALTCAACGSTANLTGLSVTGQPQSSATAATATTEPGVTSTTTPITSAGAAPSSNAATAAPSGGPVSAAAIAGEATNVASAADNTGTGVTATTISLGVDTYCSATLSTDSAAGIKGVPTLTGQQLYTAMINYVNAHGGIAGRKVTPVIYQECGTYSQQAICAAFTQDNHVFAIISDESHFDGTLLSCLTPVGVPLVNDFEGIYDQDMIDGSTSGFYLPDMISGQRLVSDWIPGLQSQGYFGSSPKVGLLSVDDPIYEKVQAGVGPALQAAGYSLAATEDISITDESTAAQEIDSAVLNFKQQGIDHVLIMDDGAELTYLFGEAAESQNYYPRLGLNSINVPQLVADNVPAKALAGAVGVGWVPQIDVNTPPDSNTAAVNQCVSIYAAEGISLSGPNNATVALLACSLVLFFKAAFEGATSISAAGFRGGVEKLGTSYQSPYTFDTTFGPNRYDGASAYRGFSFSTSCSCFQYTTAVEGLR